MSAEIGVSVELGPREELSRLSRFLAEEVGATRRRPQRQVSATTTKLRKRRATA